MKPSWPHRPHRPRARDVPPLYQGDEDDTARDEIGEGLQALADTLNAALADLDRVTTAWVTSREGKRGVR